jgi:Sulfatase-modifying factor enzyme 1
MYETIAIKSTKNRQKAVRGGSWINNAQNARSAYRNQNGRDNRNNNLGFRFALSSMVQKKVAWIRQPNIATMDQIAVVWCARNYACPNCKAGAALVEGKCGMPYPRTPRIAPNFLHSFLL